MPRGLIALLVVCAVMATVTLAAREVRLAREHAALFAEALVICANGGDFRISRTIVNCIATEVR